MPMVRLLMPTVRRFGDAFSVTDDADDHSTDLASALTASRALSRLFDSMEEDKFVLTGRRADAQGPCGNFSTTLRSIARARCWQLERLHNLCVDLGVPAQVGRWS